ncbi:hypothetical protein GW17_00015208 [Ensete ventricosum]|nr:hypothetical protein GW17_00015208 [Ensete ventricosum]
MVTSTLSFVYKPFYEYRILRVSNSPHLRELCTTLSVVAQHIPPYMVSSFTKRPACLEHCPIDGVESLNNVLLIGMTNRMDLLDEALLRSVLQLAVA